jgi:predicted phage terminase large subunit-like protein
MPGGKIAILHTRWHMRDLIGRLTKDAIMNPDADQYEIFEFPAILTSPNPDYDSEDPASTAETQKSLWPEQWSLESLLRTKASMPAWQWNAQYQQTPTAQEAAIIKRNDIRWWTKQDPPAVDYTVQAWDTALTTKERSDYSVCQTWGVWKNEDGVDNVILLNCVRGKYEFPELKRTAMQQVKDWTPDTVIVETKASGQPLVDEMRRSGIYVQEFSPGKGQDKIARVNAISDMFTSGQVWFPETWWASEVVDEILAFPAGEHDDSVDACSLALHRIRKGGLLRLASDNVDDDDYVAPRRGYY